MIICEDTREVPPEPKHKGKRDRDWSLLRPDRKSHVTRNGAGVVGQLRRERKGA